MRYFAGLLQMQFFRNFRFPCTACISTKIHTQTFFNFDFLESTSVNAVPARTLSTKFEKNPIPAAPADCVAAIQPPALAAATPPPLAMAAADINFAAKDPSTMPPAEKSAADKASGAATTARPPHH